MKFLCRKFLTALLFLFFAFNAKAVNDTLTIGQAFDWKVGDTLIYGTFTWCQWNINSSYSAKIGFAVKSKTSFADSILYTVQYFDSTNLNTILFTELDSSINIFRNAPGLNISCLDSLEPCPNSMLCSQQAYFDSSFNNYLTMKRDVGFGEAGYTFIASEHVGVRFIDSYWKGACPHYTFNPYQGCGSALIYYHSDSIIWKDTTRHFYNSISEPTPTPTFHLYPNPASDELTITTENTAPVDVFIYDMLGNCLLAHKNISDNLFTIKVKHLPPGYYLLKLTDQHGLSSSKGFIIAR